MQSHHPIIYNLIHCIAFMCMNFRCFLSLFQSVKFLYNFFFVFYCGEKTIHTAAFTMEQTITIYPMHSYFYCHKISSWQKSYTAYHTHTLKNQFWKKKYLMQVFTANNSLQMRRKVERKKRKRFFNRNETWKYHRIGPPWWIWQRIY